MLNQPSIFLSSFVFSLLFSVSPLPFSLSFLSLCRLCDDDDGGGRKQSSQYVYACMPVVDKHTQQQTKQVCFLYDDKMQQNFFSCASLVEMNGETDFLVLFLSFIQCQYNYTRI
jgi:hypothetical protein